MPAKQVHSSVPYAYPWREEPRSLTQRLLGPIGVGLLVLGVSVSLSNLLRGDTLKSAAGMIVLASLGIACLGAAIRVAPPRGAVQLINAVILTEAITPPVDSWVHLIRFRRAAIGAVIILFASGLGLLSLTGLGVHHVLTTHDPAGYLRLVPAAVLGGLGLLITIIGVRVLAMGSRTTSVGARPVGVALGESGLMLNMLGLDAHLPWSSIDGIQARTIRVGRRREREIPTIDIHSGGEVRRLTIASLATPALLAYAALKFYFDNPALRSELGTTAAQSRFDDWHAALIAR